MDDELTTFFLVQNLNWIYRAGGIGKEIRRLIQENLSSQIEILGFVNDFKFNQLFINLPLINRNEPNSTLIIKLIDSLNGHKLL
jgi:hypothetical protein